MFHRPIRIPAALDKCLPSNSAIEAYVRSRSDFKENEESFFIVVSRNARGEKCVTRAFSFSWSVWNYLREAGGGFANLGLFTLDGMPVPKNSKLIPVLVRLSAEDKAYLKATGKNLSVALRGMIAYHRLKNSVRNEFGCYEEHNSLQDVPNTESYKELG